MIYGTAEFNTTLKGIIMDGVRHPFYAETVKHAAEMAVHVNGEKPTFLLTRTRPREDPDVTAYRIDNYEPTTKADCDKALDILSKIFNPSIYSILWKDQTEESKKLQDYTLEYYPVYNSVVTFDKDVLLKAMIADPNSVIAERPRVQPENDAVRAEPISVIYGSGNVWWYDRDCFLLFIKDEEISGQKYYYFAYYDKTQYLFFKTWYTENNKTIYTEIVEEFKHNFGEIPAWFLRGKSKAMTNGEIIFESFFSSALPDWNSVVIHESDVLGAYIMHMHPQKTVWTEECQHSYQHDGVMHKCRNGAMVAVGGTSTDYTGTQCGACGGSGRTSVTSPYGVVQLHKGKLEDIVPAGLKPVEYITVPVDATKMLEERVEKKSQKAMRAINMDIEDKIGENQSGVAKVIDRSAQYDMLYNIASVVFDVHLTNQYFFKNKYMFGVQASSENKKEDKNLPEINKPTQFDILTTAERINNFAVASKSGVDKNYLRVKAIEIANSDFASSPDIKRYIVTTLNLDPLYGYEVDEISTGVNAGVIRKIDWTIHNNLKPFIDRAIEASKDFLQQDKAAQVAVLETYAKELIASEKPKIDANMIINQDVNAAA